MTRLADRNKTRRIKAWKKRGGKYFRGVFWSPIRSWRDVVLEVERFNERIIDQLIAASGLWK